MVAPRSSGRGYGPIGYRVEVLATEGITMAARYKPPEDAHLGWDDATGAECTSVWSGLCGGSNNAGRWG